MTDQGDHRTKQLNQFYFYNPQFHNSTASFMPGSKISQFNMLTPRGQYTTTFIKGGYWLWSLGGGFVIQLNMSVCPDY